ncbi:uncharacterized protein LOC121419818 [Lytechinus variegatus]|uniref:uncharacterized protein LOC121419818 n=1 Tax=Lytechinus variegatus TaxID=7654 RepID=UPI001BB2251D|nr:uncharacterized protein LOC121419818 [Lytechinus variegatus]
MRECEEEIKQACYTERAEDALPSDSISDSEIKSITKYLDREEITNLEGQDCFSAIKTWMEKERDRHANYRERLREKLKLIGKEALVPLENKGDLYHVQLADIAFRLLMTDVYPLARALGISEDKLRSYRRLYLTPSNMSRGTVGVLIKKIKTGRKMCNILKPGFPEISHLLKYAYELSYADLCHVSYGEGSKEANRNKIGQNLGINREITDIMDMLRYWRSLVKCPTYNWRTALAEAVYPVV